MATIKGTSYNLSLLAILVANALLFVIFAFGVDHLPTEWPEALERLRNIMPGALGLVLVGVLNSQLSPNAKARIVFTRWKHPLPGTRAFSDLADEDARIDVAALSRKFGPLPSHPLEQNRLWYKLYKQVDSQPSVLGIHKDYLFFRDYAVGAVAIFLALAPAAMCVASRWQPAAVYALILALQMVLVVRSARERGTRLVTTVLAIAAAAPDLE